MLENEWNEIVPYGSAYGVENHLAQERLKRAAVVKLDHSMLALAEFHLGQTRDGKRLGNAGSGGEPSWEGGDQAVMEFAVGDLPEVYWERYRSYNFLKDWIVAVTMTGWKFAQVKPQPLSNVAEELAFHVIVESAIASLDSADVDDAATEAAAEALRDLSDTVLEDSDFLGLYELDDAV